MDSMNFASFDRDQFATSTEILNFGLQSPACSQPDLSPDASSPYHISSVSASSTSISQLENDILYDPDLEAHFNAVSLYLGIDTIVLESISYLRQEGFWVSDVLQIHGALPLPHSQSEHTKALASLHHSFFNSPPPRLFDLICKFRRLAESDPAASVDRLLS